MYLLYLDDAGKIDDPTQQYAVLAGISVFERATHWVAQEMDSIAQKYFPAHSIEFHGSPMRSGSGMWRRINKEARFSAIKECLNIIAASKGQIQIFSCAVSKETCAGMDIDRYLFQSVASAFDRKMGKEFALHNKKQRGIIIFDKGKSEESIQALAHEFKYSGHDWGKLYNFAEVPLFLNSKASRLIQLADLTAYAIFRNLQFADEEFFNIVKDCFYSNTVIK